MANLCYFCRMRWIGLFAFSFLFAQEWMIIVHGGAGNLRPEHLTPTLQATVESALKEALEKGGAILAQGGSALDAVTEAVCVLEDHPFFNAGKGAVLNENGEVEMDASIMEGRTLRAGAVASVQHVKNPIRLARIVMEKTPHVLMVGQGAEELALKYNLPLKEQHYFYTPERLKQYQQRFSSLNTETVGAVAVDRYGNVAAATSTGGLFLKMNGRVGDSPIIGAGTYADNQCGAISATGHGEYFIRTAAAFFVCMLLKQGLSPEQAADSVLNTIKHLGGEGGFIVITPKKHYAMRMNTSAMFRGIMSSTTPPKVWIFKEK